MRKFGDVFLLPIICLAIVLQGCGSGGGTSTISSSTTEPATTAEPAAAANKPQKKPQAKRQHKPVKGPEGHGSAKPSQGGSGGAAAFEKPGADNSIQESGREGSKGELAQAASTLHAYLKARAGEDWPKACAQMAAGIAKSLQQAMGAAVASAKGKGPSCERLVASLSAGMPASVRRQSTVAKVGALRVTRQGAFLLYHGAENVDYFMPMAREDGRWKVAALASSPLP